MGKYLLSNYMGQGLGKLATEEFLDYVFTNKIVSRIVIKTLISNTRNQHVNKLMGFEESGRDDKYVYMELNVYPKK
ncbi:acetyltransferase domain protein [Bacteroides fragilis str. 3725 D9(v)]|nr:acetyltransferase domain protein [Bacteroides fragilis str. 3725 D9(v)]